MKFEDLYDHIGHLGAYQLCCVILVCLSTIFTVESITMIFVGADMPHWCAIPQLANYSYERQRLIALPWEDPADSTTYESCEMYKLNYDNYTHDDFLTWNRSTMLPNTTEIVSCHHWLYDQSVFVSTIVSRFNLVCGSAYLNQLISTVYMFGVLVGVTSSGAISDKIGRRITLLIYMVIRLVGFGIAFPAVHYAMLAVGRFVIGLGTSGVFLTTYVLATELVGPRFRTVVGVSLQISFSVGFVLTAPMSYAVRHDINYQIASMGGPSVLLLLLIVLIPESPRWLAVNGRKKKARKVIDEICTGNKTSLPKNFDMDDLQEETDEVEKKTCLELFRSPKLRSRTIIMDFCWFTVSFVYYALSLNTGALSGDIFVNTMLSGLVEIPANIVCIFLLDWSLFGRRLTLSGSFLLAGLVNFIGVPLTIYNYGTASTAMALVGKAFVTMSFSVIYVYSSELFPTEVRHIGIGTASMFARIASMVAPYMGEPLIEVWEPLPSVVFGSVATLAGLLGLLLPETLGHPLLDTIEQAEQYDWKKPLPKKEKNDSSKVDQSANDPNHVVFTELETKVNLSEVDPKTKSKEENGQIASKDSSDLTYQF